MSKDINSGIWTFLAETEDRLQIVADALARDLKPGDMIALHGDLGAGKTAFARTLIRTLVGDAALEVPSPTFTLLQAYETPSGLVSHYDLYRLKHVGELEELDWDDSILDTISLVEWPDRAGTLPGNRLDIEIVIIEQSDAREICLTGRGTFAPRLDRLKDIHAFLDTNDWLGAKRIHLHGDASYRSYERFEKNNDSAIFMNAPPRPDGPVIRHGRTYSDIAKLAEDMIPFVAIAKGLKAQGFHSPEIYASDPAKGLVILEDFGRQTLVTGDLPMPVVSRYDVAVDLLAAMHQVKWPNVAPLDETSGYRLPAYDEEALLIETELVLDWFAPAVSSREIGADFNEDTHQAFLDVWKSLVPMLRTPDPVWVLRDFHSPNLHWLENETGSDRIGLIDFQDAVMGHPAYDAVSLMQDARVDISVELELSLYRRYVDHRRYVDQLCGFPGFDETEFARAYAILGAQRNTKILGIFVRLARRDGKAGYLRHIPRIAGYLTRNLAHPALADLKSWYQANLPEALDPPEEVIFGIGNS